VADLKRSALDIYIYTVDTEPIELLQDT
jgi:hypothetical protein